MKNANKWLSGIWNRYPYIRQMHVLVCNSARTGKFLGGKEMKEDDYVCKTILKKSCRIVTFIDDTVQANRNKIEMQLFQGLCLGICKKKTNQLSQ